MMPGLTRGGAGGSGMRKSPRIVTGVPLRIAVCANVPVTKPGARPERTRFVTTTSPRPPLSTLPSSSVVSTNAPEKQRQQALLQVAELSLVEGQLTNATRALEDFIAQFTNSPVQDILLLTLGELNLKAAAGPPPAPRRRPQIPQPEGFALNRARENQSSETRRSAPAAPNP